MRSRSQRLASTSFATAAGHRMTRCERFLCYDFIQQTKLSLDRRCFGRHLNATVKYRCEMFSLFYCCCPFKCWIISSLINSLICQDSRRWVVHDAWVVTADRVGQNFRAFNAKRFDGVSCGKARWTKVVVVMISFRLSCEYRSAPFRSIASNEMRKRRFIVSPIRTFRTANNVKC